MTKWRSDGRAERHDRRRADILKPTGQNGVRIDVGQHFEAFFDEDFGRFERLDTQHKQPAGFQRDGEADRIIYTFGMRYKPIIQIAAKAEYQVIKNGAQTGVNQFNLSLGYIF